MDKNKRKKTTTRIEKLSFNPSNSNRPKGNTNPNNKRPPTTPKEKKSKK